MASGENEGSQKGIDAVHGAIKRDEEEVSILSERSPASYANASSLFIVPMECTIFFFDSIRTTRHQMPTKQKNKKRQPE
jgi:hypothetical protein